MAGSVSEGSDVLISPGAQHAVAAVSEAWRRVTGASPRPGVSFQDSGGDSLGLMELVFVLEQALGAKLPLDAFHGGLAVADIVALGCRMGGESVPPCSDACPTPPPAPIFLCPPMHGVSPYLAAFRRLCGDRVGVLTVDYGCWRDCLVPGFDLDHLIARTVAAVRGQQPAGPVVLAAFSAGATVAAGAALALQASGRAVVHLIILDAPAPGCVGPDLTVSGAAQRPGLATRLARLRQGGRWRGALVRRLGQVLAVPLASPWIRPVLRHAGRWQPRRLAQADLVGITQWTAYYLAERLRQQAFRRHVPVAPVGVPFPRTHLSLLRCAFRVAGAAADYGWGGWVGRLSIIPLAGRHFTIMGDDVAATAAAFVAAVTALDPRAMAAGGAGTGMRPREM